MLIFALQSKIRIFMADLLSYVQEATLWFKRYRVTSLQILWIQFQVLLCQKKIFFLKFAIMLYYVLHLKTIDLEFSNQH